FTIATTKSPATIIREISGTNSKNESIDLILTSKVYYFFNRNLRNENTDQLLPRAWINIKKNKSCFIF
ncbi:MAG TPA: hypothetical protein VMS35_04225, partial [Nitrososphaeraceae archaeon]|nr:hypothetical protein [Nitrososphaeraceae archaeon]